MGTLQQRAGRVAGRLSTTARDASKRVYAIQQAQLVEEAKREEAEKRLLHGRVLRAKRGVRRLLAFANGRTIQRLVKANAQLHGPGSTLSFYEHRWNVIGNRPVSHLAFNIGSHEVAVTMIDFCCMRVSASVFIHYKRKETTVRTDFYGKGGPSWTCTLDETLQRMADALFTNLGELTDESEVALRTLGSWSRPAPFDTVAAAFLEQLEWQTMSEARHRN